MNAHDLNAGGQLVLVIAEVLTATIICHHVRREIWNRGIRWMSAFREPDLRLMIGVNIEVTAQAIGVVGYLPAWVFLSADREEALEPWLMMATVTSAVCNVLTVVAATIIFWPMLTMAIGGSWRRSVAAVFAFSVATGILGALLNQYLAMGLR